jgi:hypothetical protein
MHVLENYDLMKMWYEKLIRVYLVRFINLDALI